MGSWLSMIQLAVEEVPAAAPAGGGQQAQPGGGSMMLMMLSMVAIFFVVQMLFGNNPRKQQERQLTMLKGLKKNDPVVTIGGIRGSFVSLSEDGTEVTLQLSENVRVRFEASAIRAVPQAAAEPAKS